jgi:hypothetical protein
MFLASTKKPQRSLTDLLKFWHEKSSLVTPNPTGKRRLEHPLMGTPTEDKEANPCPLSPILLLDHQPPTTVTVHSPSLTTKHTKLLVPLVPLVPLVSPPPPTPTTLQAHHVLPRNASEEYFLGLAPAPPEGWKLCPSPEIIATEDAPEIIDDPHGVAAEVACRTWTDNEPTNPLQRGLRAWMHLGMTGEVEEEEVIPLHTSSNLVPRFKCVPKLRGVRTNKRLQERLAANKKGLYLLSPIELRALLASSRWGRASVEDLAKTRILQPDNVSSHLGHAWRTQEPCPREIMTLAEAPQDGEYWAHQRTLSGGSSGSANPSGWSYGDIYHLEIAMKQGKFPAPSFDRDTLHNFLHGHGREDDIRKQYEIVMGARVGETGMLIAPDVWQYHPLARVPGAVYSDGIGLAARAKDDPENQAKVAAIAGKIKQAVYTQSKQEIAAGLVTLKEQLRQFDPVEPNAHVPTSIPTETFVVPGPNTAFLAASQLDRKRKALTKVNLRKRQRETDEENTNVKRPVQTQGQPKRPKIETSETTERNTHKRKRVETGSTQDPTKRLRQQNTKTLVQHELGEFLGSSARIENAPESTKQTKTTPVSSRGCSSSSSSFATSTQIGNKKMSLAQWDIIRHSRAWPGGIKHTSPDGVTFQAEGVYHNYYADVLWELGQKGQMEIKAPRRPMHARGVNYGCDDWRTEKLNSPHCLKVYYCAFQMPDQMGIAKTLPGGDKTTRFSDFVPGFVAHEREPPFPCRFFLDTTCSFASGGQYPPWVNDPSNKEYLNRWFTHDNPNRRLQQKDKESPVHAWVCSDLLVSRVRRSEATFRAMMQDFYVSYAAVMNDIDMKPLHHKVMFDPQLAFDARVQFSGQGEQQQQAPSVKQAGAKLTKEETAAQIRVEWVPIKHVVQLVHPTSETPPIPCPYVWAKHGPFPAENHVQTFTARLDNSAGLDRGVPPAGWPVDTCPWPESAWTSVYVMHFWDAKPRRNTLPELKAMS